MTRTFVRERTNEPPSEEKLKMALGEVLLGLSSIRNAATKHRFTKRTVGRYLKTHSGSGLIVPKQVKADPKYRQIILPQLEIEMVSYLKLYSAQPWAHKHRMSAASFFICVSKWN